MSQRLGDPGRWAASLRWSTCFAVAVLASAALLQAWLGGSAAARWPLTGVALAYAGLGMAFSHRALGPGPPPSPAWQWATAAVGLALTAAAATRVSPEAPAADWVSAGTLVVAAPGASAMVLALRWRWAALLGLAGTHAALTAAVLGSSGISGRACAALAAAGFVATLVLASAGRLTAWMREAGRELAAARDARARLAVADERLRFARDLHDVHGRTLAAVSVHSQVSAELARRGDPAAVEHMLEVRRLAQESLGATRRLVTGYRDVALAEEMDAARALLRAGGIEARVTWPGPDDVPDRAASSALAAVVREGVTNILRHSTAGEVSVRLERRDDAWRLTLENDGLRTDGAGHEATGPTPAGAAGATARGDERPSGLAGLRERLACVGGSLDVDPRDGRYVLIAQVPNGARE